MAFLELTLIYKIDYEKKIQENVPRLGFNFTNIIQAAFALVDPKSVKNTDKSSLLFYTFGLCTRKSCTYNVDEITVGVNFINIFCLRFLYEFLAKAKT